MTVLLGNRYAPITSSIGFLDVPLDIASAAMRQWLETLYGNVGVSHLRDGFPEVLHRLEPLTAGARPRQLLVSAGQWTAYFDSSLRGTDAVSAIGHLSRSVPCRGVAISSIPDDSKPTGGRRGRYGAESFELFGPEPTGFLNYVRTVAVTNDDGKWVFTATGHVQPYEDSDAYEAKHVRDRFTSEMLDRYCRALGINAFEANAFGPNATLFESPARVAPGAAVMTLSQAREWLGIREAPAAMGDEVGLDPYLAAAQRPHEQAGFDEPGARP